MGERVVVQIVTSERKEHSLVTKRNDRDRAAGKAWPAV